MFGHETGVPFVADAIVSFACAPTSAVFRKQSSASGRLGNEALRLRTAEVV